LQFPYFDRPPNLPIKQDGIDKVKNDRQVAYVGFAWRKASYTKTTRSKEKLIILANFEMMLNGWTTASSLNYRSPAHNLARLIESKHGKIIDTPKIIAI
jgi:hypothetical protein